MFFLVIFLSSSSETWRDILPSRYEYHVVSSFLVGRSSWPFSSFSWWRGMSLLESKTHEPFDSIVVSLRKKVDISFLSSFWNDYGWGMPRLDLGFIYFIPSGTKKKGKVCEIGLWENVNLARNLQWRRSIFEYEKKLVDELLLTIQGTTFFLERDRWFWWFGEDSA